MISRTAAKTSLMIAAIALFAGALWVGVDGQAGAEGAAPQAAPPLDDIAARQPAANPDSVTSAPVVVAPAQMMPVAINGLHVICPLTRGRTVHLLLTAETYYKAVTPEEVALLTERFGPAITNIDPTHLPPKSRVSVTEILTQHT